ncbi:MAG: PAS domain S-box protein, partial [Hyphomicrobiaceae bacterium]
MQAALSGAFGRLAVSIGEMMDPARQVAARLWKRHATTSTERDPRIVSRLATAAVTGLGLLGLATTGVWMAGRFMHADPSLLAVEISVASRQRILVARVTTLAEQIAHGPTDSSVRDELAACTKRMMAAHIALLAGSEARLRAIAEQPVGCTSAETGWLVSDGRVSSRSAVLMQSGPDSLDAVMRRFTSAALVVSTLTAQDDALAARLGEIARVGTTALPERIDALVEAIRRNTEIKGQHWHNAADIALALVYLGLLVFWARLFQPIASAATKAFRELAETNVLLADRRKELEEANARLSETAARFRSLSDLSADWYWRTDREHRFCEVSDGIGRRGLLPERLIGQRLQDLIDQTTPAAAEGDEILAGYKSFRSFEFRLSRETPDADDHWLSVSGEPILAADGTFIGYRGVGRDVTRRRQATEALAQSTAKLEALIDAAPVAIAMFDREMRYITCTQRWIADYGLAGQTLIGRSHYDVFPNLPENFKEIHRRCLAGAVERIPEARISAPSGREMVVRREVRPWHDASGEIGGIIILNDDITAIATAIRSLQKSQERFRLLFDIAPVGLCLADPADGRILMASRTLSSMTGFSPAELKQLPLSAVAHGLPQTSDRPAPAEQAPAAAVEVMIQKNGGGEIAAIYSELSFLDEHNHPLRLAAIQDISWRREQEEGLWRAAHIDQLTGLPNRLLLT